MSTNWVFFLGVHCTITPTLVQTCELERSMLKKFETVVILPNELRNSIEKLNLDPAVTAKDENIWLAEFCLRMNDKFKADEDVQKVLLVEEALLGATRKNTKSGLLYPNLKKKMTAIPDIFDNPWHTICFCVTPYHEFFENCYLDSPVIASQIDVLELKKKVLQFERTWITVLEDISSRLPNIGVQIWRSDTTNKLRLPIERILFNGAAGFFPNEIEFGNSYLRKKKRNRRSIWTQDEVDICRAQFESDWYHITNGWSDYIIK